jgi:putative endonuclease
MDQKELGKFGEQLAIRHLRKNGYQILDCNWRYGKIELDIICSQKEHVVFVEVKTRNNNFAGEPWEFVTRAKQSRIIRAADKYLIAKNLALHCRFDVVSIIHNKRQTQLEHLIDAFYPLP